MFAEEELDHQEPVWTEPARIAEMPNLPDPFAMREWKQVARRYDALAFDRDAHGQFCPLIWDDPSRLTSDLDGFGLYTVPGHPGQGPIANPSYHEGINCVAAVVGASLVGIDKRRQNGYDYVRMCETYFSSKEIGGADIFGNLAVVQPMTGSMWYFLFPNMLAFMLGHCYPGYGKLDELLHRSADRLGELVPVLEPGDWYTGYDFVRGEPVTNGRWTEGDAVAGLAWTQYMAFAKFGDDRYLYNAYRLMSTLLRFDCSPLYEVLLPFGAILAARMNAEQGCNFSLPRLLDWCFDGSSACRPGWGVIADRWGGYDVHGLQGSVTDGGGYAFAMNTFELVAALAPLPRYDARYARAIGKLILNAANASRLFYANGLPASNQTCFDQAAFTRDAIAYEGLRRVGLRRQDATTTPCACGDPLGGRWGAHAFQSDFSLYGSSHVGMMASVIDQQPDSPGILRIDCLKTDFFHAAAYPTFLLYNPHPGARETAVDVGTNDVDLYDAVEHRFIARHVNGATPVNLAPDSARLLVLVSAGGAISRHGNTMSSNGIAVDFAA
jgi:hypothetical protein